MNTAHETPFRVGLLVPSSNATMERDFHKNLPEGVFTATSRMFLDETTKQAEIRMIEESLPLSALSREFAEMGARKLVVLTPYVDELNASIRASLEEDGMEVLSIDGMGITDNIEIGNTRADKILKFADERLSPQNLKKADCLFISCTNLPAVDALPEIHARYPDLPLMTSNLAALLAVRRKFEGE